MVPDPQVVIAGRTSWSATTVYSDENQNSPKDAVISMQYWPLLEHHQSISLRLLYSVLINVRMCPALTKQEKHDD